MAEKQFKTGSVIAVSLSHLAHDIYTSFLAPLLPLLIEKFGISYTLAGLMRVIHRVPSLLNPFAGIIAEKVSMRYFIIISPSVTAITMSLLGLAPTYTVAVILLFIAGISATLYHVPSPVLVRQVSGDKVGKGMSFFMAGGELSRTLGPLAILGAVSLWGLEGIFRVCPVGIAASLVLYYKIKNIRISPQLEKNTAIETGYRDTFIKYAKLFFLISGIIFFRGAMKAALTLYLPTYIKLQGSTLWFAGISLSILQVSGVIGTFVSGTLSDKLGRRNVLLITSIVTPIFMFLFTMSGKAMAIPLLIVTGIFLFFTGPVLLAIIHELDTSHKAFVNGIYITIGFVFNSVMVFLMGGFSDLFGLPFIFKASAFVGLLAIPFVLKIRTTMKQTPIGFSQKRNINNQLK